MAEQSIKFANVSEPFLTRKLYEAADCFKMWENANAVWISMT